METIFQSEPGKNGQVRITQDFVFVHKPRMISVFPIRHVTYVGYPKEWDQYASVQVFCGEQEHNLYVTATEAKTVVDTLLNLIAAR